MDVLLEKIKQIITEYGAEVSNLSIGTAIELFKDIRHYPSSYDDDGIISDLTDNVNKIAMAAIEIEAKNGMEGQISQTENGMTRGYTENILAYRGVVGFAFVI